MEAKGAGPKSEKDTREGEAIRGSPIHSKPARWTFGPTILSVQQSDAFDALQRTSFVVCLISNLQYRPSGPQNAPAGASILFNKLGF